MKTIICPFCGENSENREILVVPDKQAMETAITNHAHIHIQNTNSCLFTRIYKALMARFTHVSQLETTQKYLRRTK